MNANELADELAETGEFFEDSLYLQAETMIRRLQAENEALKKQLAQANRVYDFDNPLLDKAQEK